MNLSDFLMIDLVQVVMEKTVRALNKSTINYELSVCSRNLYTFKIKLQFWVQRSSLIRMINYFVHFEDTACDKKPMAEEGNNGKISEKDQLNSDHHVDEKNTDLDSTGARPKSECSTQEVKNINRFAKRKWSSASNPCSPERLLYVSDLLNMEEDNFERQPAICSPNVMPVSIKQRRYSVGGRLNKAAHVSFKRSVTIAGSDNMLDNEIHLLPPFTQTRMIHTSNEPMSVCNHLEIRPKFVKTETDRSWVLDSGLSDLSSNHKPTASHLFNSRQFSDTPVLASSLPAANDVQTPSILIKPQSDSFGPISDNSMTSFHLISSEPDLVSSCLYYQYCAR